MWQRGGHWPGGYHCPPTPIPQSWRPGQGRQYLRPPLSFPSPINLSSVSSRPPAAGHPDLNTFFLSNLCLEVSSMVLGFNPGPPFPIGMTSSLAHATASIQQGYHPCGGVARGPGSCECSIMAALLLCKHTCSLNYLSKPQNLV